MPKFSCTNCSQRIEVRDVYIGRCFACPTCNVQLRVPEKSAPSLSGNPGFSIGEFYFSFEGRISVEDYWVKGVFVMFLLGIVVMMADLAVNANGFLSLLLLIPSIWVGAALLVKRWHDRNKSGWYYWVLFIPLVGPFWTLIEAGCMKGTKGNNRFGPDPIRKRR
jgi:uncharacterized membrane protein YhaH (DUF805 family)